MKKPSKEISIGARIKEIFEQSEMSISQFAKLLHCDRSNINNIFRRKKIDIDLLLEISKALNHDFVGETYKKHALSKDISNVKISLVFQLNNIEDKTLKILLKTIKQLEKNAICEIKNS